MAVMSTHWECKYRNTILFLLFLFYLIIIIFFLYQEHLKKNIFFLTKDLRNSYGSYEYTPRMLLKLC